MVTDARIIHGNCLYILPSIGRCDHVITDPPYTQAVSDGCQTSKRRGSAPAKSYSRPLQFSGIDGQEHVYVPAMLDICDRWCIAFCAFEQIGSYESASNQWAQSKRKNARGWVRAGVWRKPVPTPQFTGDRPGVCGEALAIMHPPGEKRWNRGGCAGYWCSPKSEGIERYGGHPTPKPVRLMIELIEAFTDPGDLIVDPFAGSGTTGIACMRTGRRFIGIELNDEYANLASRRIAAEADGSDLRSVDRGQKSLFEEVR